MKKFTVLIAFALLALSGLAYASPPVELLTKIHDVSTWTCMPTQSTLGHSTWFSGIARSPGLAGSYWKTEGVITSVANSAAPEANTMLLKVYGSVTPLLSLTLAPWTTVGATDVVGALDLPDGVYVINAEYPDNMSITLRTYNDLGSGGTYGSTLPALTAFNTSYVSWPLAVGRRWLYVVAIDNADFYLTYYSYDGTLTRIEEVDGSSFAYVQLVKFAVADTEGFVVITQNSSGGYPSGYDPHPAVMPYGTGVDVSTGAPSIYTATPYVYAQ